MRERGQDINQPIPQTSQPETELIQPRVTEDTPQEDLNITSSSTRQPLPDRLNITEERERNDVGTNTLDVEVRSSRDGPRALTMEPHTSILIVDVLLPSGHEDHVRIPHVNLSIMGYHPETLRTLVGARSSTVRTPEVSTIPQLDGPRSLPRHESERRQMDEVPDSIGLSSSQRGTYT